VAFLLFFTAVLRGRNAQGLAMYCLSLGVWTTMILLIAYPSTAQIGERLAAIGAFNAAGFLHAAWDLTKQRRYRLVWLAYAVALAITLLGIGFPGVLYGPRAMAPGPLFWPAMALAALAAAIPMWTLSRSYRQAPQAERSAQRRLFFAGALSFSGGMGNAILLAHGVPLPIGLYLVLGALLVLANVIRAQEPPAEQRLLERSLLYSALAAFLSAGFLFGVMLLMPRDSTPLLPGYRWGTLLLLCMAALAFEPVRQQIQERVGKSLIRDRANTTDLARALARQESRADQSERLAQLGGLVSAVAHEVRNPLGVLTAHLKLLERSGGPPETIAAMREQIVRAGHFVDELLRYGRPRSLELRLVDVTGTVGLALSTARQGLGLSAEQLPAIEIVPAIAREQPIVEADQAQLEQVLVILFENALLALADAPVRALRVTIGGNGEHLGIVVEDSGRGIPADLLPRLFEPFVTGRPREGPRAGTGLGLAIARGIVERHGGTIQAGRSELGGARFVLELPRVQPVLAAATAV